jgi:hypothetical protein
VQVVTAFVHVLGDSQTYEDMIKAFLIAAATTGGGVLGAKVVNKATSIARQVLSRLYIFLASVMSGRWEQASDYIHEKVQTGLRRLNGVASNEQYRKQPIQLLPGTRQMVANFQT